MADISVWTDYTRTILHSIREMTETCDFIINVDDESFPVHRNVISAASSYFRAMFSSNMKEAQQGFADMETIKPAVMEKCIDFMYTGEIKVQMDEVQYILIASNLLQLDLLTEISFTQLQENLSTSNCLVVSHYATVLNKLEVKKLAELKIINNFEDVISTDKFPTISFEDFSRYFFESVAGHEIKWGALVKWLLNKREETKPIYQKLLETLEYFPLDFLIKKALEGLMKKPVKKNTKTSNKMRRNLVLDFLFEDIEKFKREVNLEISGI
uniref:kelch-like protein 12 n=1 Tax=Styela clava TaxID=7725 RepID=UPI00193AB2BE|nr:kelch-like protein 12 [Styela clava]